MSRRDLDAVWTVLESSTPVSGIEVAGTGWNVTAGEILVGVDAGHNRHLLIPLLAGEAARTDTRGQAVQVRRVNHEDTQFLTVVCLAPELRAVFSQFAGELLVSIDEAPSPARAAVEALERWRSLFSVSAPRGVIGESRLIGLIGELLTLADLLERGAPSDAAYWTGPRGHQHDFRSPAFALEVKATTVREGRIISISSIDQLDAPPGVQLGLVHYQLDRDPGGFNLDELVERVRVLGCDAHSLLLALSENEVDPGDLGRYADRRFRVVATRIYDVEASAFPRIVRTSFEGGDIPPGTLRLSYSIDLTNEPPTPMAEGDVIQLMQDMARDAAHGMGS